MRVAILWYSGYGKLRDIVVESQCVFILTKSEEA